MADKYEHSLKNERDKWRGNGVFYTPEPLARYMATFLPDNVREVYDPTCGNGNLLAIFGDDVRKYGQELDLDQLAQARERLTNFEGVAGDTLKAPAFTDRKFAAIMANPPYSVKWDPPASKDDDSRFSAAPALAPKSKADYAFLLHILHLLADDGVAVVLCFPGILYRGNAEEKIRRWMVENNYINTVVQVADKQFTDTSIATVILVLRKNKTTTDVRFVDQSRDIERMVTLEEIQEHNYNLSVSTYIEPSDTREPIDVDAVNAEIDQAIVTRLLSGLMSQKFVYEVFERDVVRFPRLLANVQQVITMVATMPRLQGSDADDDILVPVLQLIKGSKEAAPSGSD